MKRNIPQVVVEANAFINGKGYLGIVKNLKVPTIEFETIEAKGAPLGQGKERKLKLKNKE